jgi:hypothetical protein
MSAYRYLGIVAALAVIALGFYALAVIALGFHVGASVGQAPNVARVIETETLTRIRPGEAIPPQPPIPVSPPVMVYLPRFTFLQPEHKNWVGSVKGELILRQEVRERRSIEYVKPFIGTLRATNPAR